MTMNLPMNVRKESDLVVFYGRLWPWFRKVERMWGFEDVRECEDAEKPKDYFVSGAEHRFRHFVGVMDL